MLWVHSRRGSLLTDRAAQFDGSTKVSAANTGSVFSPPGNTDLVVNFWFSFDTLPASGVAEIMNVTGNAVATDGWFIFQDSATNFLHIGSSDGTAYANLAFSAQAITVNTWYMAYCSWDNTGGAANYTISLYTVAGLINTNSAGGRFINSASPQPLNIGGGVGGQQWAQCRIDKVGIWTPTPPEAVPDSVALWNGGAGLSGSQVQTIPALMDNLVAYYDLNEPTGSTTWADYFGNRNATATGTVVSVPPAGSF